MSWSIPQTKTSQPTKEGIYLIDKPTGITSHDVVDEVRKITGIRRVGHAGTLDPLATGLLIILVGRQYTKQQSQFLRQDKEYLCTARLGVTTDTYDIDGEVIDQASWSSLAKIDRKQVKQQLQQFQGIIDQTVPPYSAVKKNGDKLYELARVGKLEKKDLPTKQVEIKKIALQAFQKNQQQQELALTLQLTVSSGTYIRSLVHDLGKKLRVGATVTKLRRTKVGQFDISQAISLDKLF
jgi:tRNA pseudouridine55 synthase